MSCTRGHRAALSLAKLAQLGKIRKFCPVASRLQRAACGEDSSADTAGKYPLSLLALPHSFPPFPFPCTHSSFHFRIPHGGGFPISTKCVIEKKIIEDGEINLLSRRRENARVLPNAQSRYISLRRARAQLLLLLLLLS